MQIIKNTRNELLKRNEIAALVKSPQNPNFAEMRKQISEQINKPEENINVYNILGSFGSNEFKVYAYVYDSRDSLEKNKIKTRKQKEAEIKEAKEKAEKSKESSLTEEVKAEPSPK